MNASAATILVATIFACVSVVPARAQRQTGSAPTQAAGQTITGQSTTSAIETPAPLPGQRTIAKVGDVSVGIWAPVQAPYNVNNNRNLAANPIWNDNMATPSGF